MNSTPADVSCFYEFSQELSLSFLYFLGLNRKKKKMDPFHAKEEED